MAAPPKWQLRETNERRQHFETIRALLKRTGAKHSDADVQDYALRVGAQVAQAQAAVLPDITDVDAS